MFSTEKSRRVKELEQLEVERALKNLEKFRKLFTQDKED